jgi:hypothetical protein
METRALPILSSSCLTGISNAVAYSFNATVVPQPAGQNLNYLTLWPDGEPMPVVSTLNNPTATVVANAAIVPTSSNGEIDAFTYNTTDLILDINGYFAPAGSGGYSMYPTSSCRVVDTRQNNGQPFSGTLSPPVDVAGSQCAPPASAGGYIFNATVVPNGSLGYLTLWPDTNPQQQPPNASTLNAYDGLVTSNLAIVPNSDGKTDVLAGDGSTWLIMDISGYFAP